jgi:hypothetical protein
MALIKNNTSKGIDFVVHGAATDGVPPTAHIPAGQSRDIDCDTASPQIKGMEIAGAITIIGAAPANKPASLADAASALELSPKPKHHERKL